MTPAEAHAAAAAEGLRLVCAENATGFKGVYNQSQGKPFQARLMRRGREKSLGTFATAEEAVPPDERHLSKPAYSARRASRRRSRQSPRR